MGEAGALRLTGQPAGCLLVPEGTENMQANQNEDSACEIRGDVKIPFL